MSDWAIRDGESENEYVFRVCQDKDLIGTWDDVAKIINENLGQSHTESRYRKQYKKLSDAVQAAGEQTRELQRERYKLQATKLELQRQLRTESRFELFYENLRSVIQKLDPPEFRSVSYDVDSDKAWVLGIGDLHYGATFKSKNNEYSRDICKRRLEQVAAWLLQREDATPHQLKIVNVADTIQGILRMKDLQINDIPVVESVVEISRLLAASLNALSERYEVVYYHVPCANHSQTRPLGSRASELATEDLEKVIVSYIKDMLAFNSRVKVVSSFAHDYLEFDIFEFKAIALHGHQIKNPENVIRDLQGLHHKLYDYAFLGHRHSPNEIVVGEGENYNIEVITCPSLVGSDPYSDSLMVGCRPMVRLYQFDEKYGHIGSESLIL